MKNLLLLLFVTCLFYSCETVEINAPGFQANLEGFFYKANDSKGIRRSGNSYTIQGITENEIITLKVSSSNVGVYVLGGNSENYALYEDSDGNQYSTIPGGSGEISITRNQTDANFFNGNFKFTAILAGQDTITVDRGVFFQVPYDENIDLQDDDIPNTTETFIAKIDNEDFNPFTIDISQNATSIIINAFTGSKIIKLIVPNEVTEGVHPLSELGYDAYATIDGTLQNANTGSINIIENDTENRILNGIFSFQTESHNVTEGTFNIVYF
ncbi:MAG: hypothetical protein KUG68_06285 [Flavobacteriaceae bacterium]|nr:hypothetical protein [Flavobacteriaceae bacterium]